MMKQLILMLMSCVLFATTAVAQPVPSSKKESIVTSTKAQWDAALANEERGQDSAGSIGTSDGLQLAGKLFQVVLWTLITCLLAYMILGKMPEIATDDASGAGRPTRQHPKG